MLHQFLQKLLISIFIAGSVLSAEPSFPSLLQDFKKINANKKVQFSSLQNSADLAAIPIDAKLQLSRNQLESILYFAPLSYQRMFKEDPCSLMIFFKDETLFLREKQITQVEVDVISNSQNRKAKMSITDFANQFLKTNCKDVSERANLFLSDSLEETLKRITPEPPVNKQACFKQWNDWQGAKDTAHICSRVEKILFAIFEDERLKNNPNLSINERSKIATLRREKELYLSKFSDYQFSYYNNVCKNLNTKTSFCSNYVSQDIWGLIINNQEPEYKMKYKCQKLIKKDMTKKSHYTQCSNILRKFPSACHYGGISTNSSLAPMPSCHEQSRALLKSRLFTDYRDCPYQVNNPAVINFNRIVAHFKKEPPKESANNCVFPAFSSVYSSYIETKEENKWPLSLCFNDPLTKKEKCYPYVPGNHDSLSYAQNNVISNILFIGKFNESRPKCKIEEPGVYNPARLKYRTNCWILPQNKNCLRFDCPQKVILDNKNVVDVYTKGKLSFQYYKNKFSSFDQALVDRLSEIHKLKTSSISSISSAKFFLDSKKEGLIHGLGCIEDLYPEYFQTYSIGQCHPIPFIIDGYTKEGELVLFSFRTAIDDIHSPRLLEWPTIFTSITRYRAFHPLKNWSLNGLF